MKTLIFCLSLLLSIATLPARADTPAELQGTTWEGEFRTLGTSGRIRLAFLNETNGRGALQYFSKPTYDGFLPPAGWLLSQVNKTCEFTPRAFETEENGGTIRVYACAPTAAEERELAADPARAEKLALTVRRLTIDENGENLVITAVKGPIRVKYRFKRTDASETARTPEELRAWADQLQ
jgi:hypothetical protein